MRFRMLKPGAAGAYRSILARTSSDDRYFRYLRAVDGWEPAVVDRFGCASTRIGFVAEERGVPLGVAHGAPVDARTAEIAVIVARDARRRGVGHGVVAALVTYLRSLGYDRFVASSLRENDAFARLAARIGLRVAGVDGATVRWESTPSAQPLLAHGGARQPSPIHK